MVSCFHSIAGLYAGIQAFERKRRDKIQEYNYTAWDMAFTDFSKRELGKRAFKTLKTLDSRVPSGDETKGRTIRKVMGRSGGEIHAREGESKETENVQRREGKGKKTFLQSELHSGSYSHLIYTAVLISWSF